VVSTPAQTLGIANEAYVTPTFTQKPPQRRIAIRFTTVANEQHIAVSRDDKAAAAV
jgi:hypothetical protein